MKIILRAICILGVMATGCATAPRGPKASGDFKDFRTEFALANRKIHESLKFTPGFSFMSFGKDAYRAKLKAQNPALDRELDSFDEVVVGTSPSSFVICVKSLKEKIAICDNSGTAVVDRVKVTNPLPELRELMDEVRGP